MADRRLQVFHTVARLLSFTKAAEALHMTQPAVTFQVRQLEEHFDTRLFDRTHNRISLTEAGACVYAYADRIFDLYGQMEGAVRDLTGDVSGPVLLGASTTIAEYMLPSLLGEFKRKFPEVNIRLRVANTEGVVSMVEENDVDLGVVEGAVGNRNLSLETFRIDQLVAVVPPAHPFAARESLAATDLLEHPYIAREEGSGTRGVIREYLRAGGVDPDAVELAMELGSPEAIKGAVEAGMGISVLSLGTVRKEMALGTLVAVPFDPPLERPFYFVRQKQKFRVRATEELLAFARAYSESHPAPGASRGDDARARTRRRSGE